MRNRILNICIYLLFPLSTLADSLHIPENFDTKSAKVVVVIHGCLQSAEAIAAGSGWNTIADKHNLFIYYPQVPKSSNILDCWSWYNPLNQSAKWGQLKKINTQLDKYLKIFKISKAPVFVTGISAGGAMAAGLLACYPEIYKAGALISSPVYGSAHSIISAQRVLKFGPGPLDTLYRPCSPSEFKGPVMVIHGLADKTVHPSHAKKIVKDFHPQDLVEKKHSSHKNDAHFHVTKFYFNNLLKAELVEVEGLEHAWSGSERYLKNKAYIGSDTNNPTILPFFDTRGPSATELIWNFFRNGN
jgi:poly(hydroxyalkanoate) depolymerase family esterase